MHVHILTYKDPCAWHTSFACHCSEPSCELCVGLQTQAYNTHAQVCAKPQNLPLLYYCSHVQVPHLLNISRYMPAVEILCLLSAMLKASMLVLLTTKTEDLELLLRAGIRTWEASQVDATVSKHHINFTRIDGQHGSPSDQLESQEAG